MTNTTETVFTYAELAQTCAFYGFVDMPITHQQVQILQEHDLDAQDAYGVCCDVECGIPFAEALDCAIKAKQFNDDAPPAGVLSFTHDDIDWEAEVVHGLLRY